MVSYRVSDTRRGSRPTVLILIVMDNGLLQAAKKKAEAEYVRLNPYCNG